MERRMVVTQRDCPARLVPVGTPIMIPKDTFVTLTQALGGSYTVTVNGNMARVDGTDADALGLEGIDLDFEASADGQISREQVFEVLQTIYDPEIPVDVVSLGLVYEVGIDQDAREVYIRMTLTAPGCGMGPVLVGDIESRVMKVPHVRKITVDLVFDPPWTRDMMSDEARLATGLFY
ncbi:MAG: putative Fe-S cluster assembly protein SufT [Pseudomonadales bacterium]|jgi:probable FeS assembly SUF system protein SufT|nr:putative Fe-S cluster assembly protein SufT [Pseudomonadales bacterium]MCP5337021.1 putative Fe-S cluster assembly protein SufT [Pseudomonadales bacterium]